MFARFGGFAAVALLIAAPFQAEAGLVSGELLVSDLDTSSVFAVDPSSGNRVVFSGGGTGSGTDLSNPQGIAVEASGTVLVADNGVDALFAIDPATGNRSLLSGTGVGSGQALVLPFGVTATSGGSIYLADAGDQAGDSFVVRIDPITGARTLVSGLGTGSGDAFGSIRGIVVAGDGSLIVSDVANQALYRVDPVTGARTILSDSTHGSGVDFGAPNGMTLDAAGNILVADPSDGAIIRVDPVTGDRTLFSALGAGTGPDFTLPFGITHDLLGRVIVADSGDSSVPTLPALFALDPTTGDRSVLSNYANGTGPNFQNLDLGLALFSTTVVPEPSSLALLSLGSLILFRVARSRRC